MYRSPSGSLKKYFFVGSVLDVQSSCMYLRLFLSKLWMVYLIHQRLLVFFHLGGQLPDSFKVVLCSPLDGPPLPQLIQLVTCFELQLMSRQPQCLCHFFLSVLGSLRCLLFGIYVNTSAQCLYCFQNLWKQFELVLPTLMVLWKPSMERFQHLRNY